MSTRKTAGQPNGRETSSARPAATRTNGSARPAATSLAALAWRNVFRNRRRSTLNIIALTVGMAILVLALGWIGGYHSYIYDTLNDFQTGEIQVVHADWYAERTRLPVDSLIGNQTELRSAALSLPAVRSAAPRVVFSARVSTGRESFRIAATAIDLELEETVSVFDEYVVAGPTPSELAAGTPSAGGGAPGATDSPGVPGAAGSGDVTSGAGPGATNSAAGRAASAVQPRGLWIGRPVAEKAGIAVGDTLFLRAMNRHGVENLYDAPVVGIFEYGYPILDQQMIYLDLATATELLDLDGGVTHLVIRLHEGEDVREAVRAVGAAASGVAAPDTPAAGTPTSGTAERVNLTQIEGSRGGVSPAGSPLQIRPWQDFARAAVSAVEGDTYSFTIMVIVMYLLIVLGILNSMSMSVHERTREIGTIRAIGIKRRRLLGMFALESVWQSLIAAAIALVITTPVALWLVNTGVDIASSMPEEMPVPFGERFRADFAVWHYLLTPASGVLTALVGAIIPARRAGKITVAEAMRTVG